MIKILINAIGKEKNGQILALQGDYIKRMPWEIKILEHICNKDAQDINLIQQEEGRLLLHSIPKAYMPILLDEKGRQFSSQEFATLLNDKIFPEHQHIAFMIGGAFGHSSELKKQGWLSISLSQMTFAHKLVRLILLEQIYRAHTIISGHPYHK